MMNLSRVLANIGAHDDDAEISADDIATIESFIRSLFEYVYVAPAQVEALRKQIEERQGT